MFRQLFQRDKMYIDKLRKGEEIVKTRLLDVCGWPVTTESVAEKLSLIVEYADIEDKYEAKLISDCNANGKIIVNTKHPGDDEFNYLHEVIHYVIDVGIGKKVDANYSRKYKGNSSIEHERDIDYMASVALIPGNELLKYLEHYRRQWYKINEVEYMKELEKKFKCSETCLQKRLREVHLLRKHKLLPIES